MLASHDGTSEQVLAQDSRSKVEKFGPPETVVIVKPDGEDIHQGSFYVFTARCSFSCENAFYALGSADLGGVTDTGDGTCSVVYYPSHSLVVKHTDEDAFSRWDTINISQICRW